MHNTAQQNTARNLTIMSRSPYAPPLPYGGLVLSLTILLGGFVWARRADATAVSTGINSKNKNNDNDGVERDNASPNRWGWEAGTKEGGEEQEGEEGDHAGRGFRTSSSAYQTDHEADLAQAAAQRRRRRQQNDRSVTGKDSAIYFAVTKRTSTSPPPPPLTPPPLTPPPPATNAARTVAESHPSDDKPAATPGVAGRLAGPVGKATKPFDAAAAAAAAAAAGAAAAGVVGRARPARLSRAEQWRLEREAFRVRVHEHVRRELDRKLAPGSC